MRTIEDCARAAFAALLRGDLAERDRQIALARNLLNAAERIKQSGDYNKVVVGEPICLPDHSKEAMNETRSERERGHPRQGGRSH